ncbi:MAG TPA: HNH endonuclease signature motif containing protein [Candidatus Anoxymicrobiaceae bacterium]
MRKKRYPEEELVEAIRTSRSIRQALMKVGIAPYGGNYATVRMLIEKYQIDTSHMTGQGWNKGDIMGLKAYTTYSLEEILIQNSHYANTSDLRKRIIAAGLKEAVCEKCWLGEWNGKKISLELNHINGDRFDHRIENLELLCPNCHAQTHTYRGKNMGNGARRM